MQTDTVDLGFVEVKPNTAEESLGFVEIDREVPELRNAPPATFIDKLKAFFTSPEEDIAKAQNVYALSEETGLTLKDTYNNYDLLRRSSKVTGLTPDLERREYMAIALMPLVATAAVAHPIGTVAGLLSYAALDKAIPVDKMVKKLEEKMGGELSSSAKTTIDLIDFMGKALIIGGVFKKAPKLAERFLKTKLVEYNMAKEIKLSSAQVRDIYQTGKLTTAEQASLFGSLQLKGEALKTALSKGVKISIPPEKLVSLVDKPFWAKIKKIVGVESKPKITTEFAGKPEKAVAGLIEGKVEGEIPTPPVVPEAEPVQKIINALKGAKDIRGQQETLYHKARKQKLAKMMAVGEKVKGEKGFFAEKGALKGELPKVEFESIRKQLSQPDIDALFDMVKVSPHLSPWDKLTAREGLANLMGETGGKVPTESEIAKLHKVFGKEFTDTLLEKRPLLEKMKEAGLQIANLPRSIMASYDLSFGLRQGSFAAPRFRREFFDSFKKQFSWFGSERAFQENQKVIASNLNYPLAIESGVQFTEMDSLMKEREERFASQWAEIVPGVRQSARAYTAFANKYRMDIFDTLVQDAEKLGLNPQENRDLSKKIAKFVNNATGRGSLGDFESSALYLNALFFSPRLMASRVGILTKLFDPRFYYKESPFIRKEFLKTILSWLGTGLSIMGIAKLMGAEVGDDPRSSDFGKIRIGDTRIDHWGGFQPYIRMVGQLISGQYKSSTTGKIVTLGEGYRPLTRLEILQRQIESKQAPVFSLITELLKGQTFEGKKINIPKAVALRFIPMVVQDLYDIVKENPDALPAIILAPFGVGIQTYKPKSRKKF